MTPVAADAADVVLVDAAAIHATLRAGRRRRLLAGWASAVLTVGAVGWAAADELGEHRGEVLQDYRTHSQVGNTLREWSEVLMRGIRHDVSDRDLDAANIDPGAPGVRPLLGAVRRIDRAMAPNRLEVAYTVDEARRDPDGLVRVRGWLTWSASDGAGGHTVSAEPRDLTLVPARDGLRLVRDVPARPQVPGEHRMFP